jgi:hypothetical protein
MALLKGNAACTTGLSKRIYDYRTASASTIGIGAGTANQDAIKADCYAIACAVVDEIVANASVAVSVPGTGLVAPGGGGPVTGSAAGTGTVT